MGLFDRFKSQKPPANAKDASAKGGKDGKKDAGKASPVAKWAEAAGDKRAQNYDRHEAIEELATLAGPPETPDTAKAAEQDTVRTEAALALLKRFTFTIDPSIIDQEEKETTFNAVLKAGKLAIPAIRTFAVKAESLAWPMRVMRELLDEEDFVGEVVTLLDRWDTEYSKFIDAKLQLLTELAEHKDARIRVAVEPFLADVNETARNLAVAATLAQDDETSIAQLLQTLEVEESFRVKNKIVDGMAARSWAVPEEEREKIRKVLPAGYSIGADGLLSKR